MKRRKNRIPSTENDLWFKGYGEDGFFCLPRTLLEHLSGHIDNATFYAYVVVTSYHFEGNTTYPGEDIARRMGKNARNTRRLVEKLEMLGLIRREPLGRGFKILFQCPTKAQIKEGAALIEPQRLEKKRLREEKKVKKSNS